MAVIFHHELKDELRGLVFCAGSGSANTGAGSASAVGVGSVINKLDNMVGMIAGIRGLKESLDNSLNTQKIS